MRARPPNWSMLLALALLAAPAGAEERRKLAVLALKADTEFPEGTESTLNEILLGELSSAEDLEVIGASDVRSMLLHEEQKALLARCTENDCLLQIGAALGASLVVAPSVGAVGEQYVVSLKLIDVAEARVLHRVNEFVDRKESRLVAGLRRAVQGVLGKLGVAVAAGEEPLAAPAESGGSPWGQVAFWSGVAGLALGGTALVMARGAAQDYEDGDLDARETSRTWAGVMWAGLGAGTTLATAGVLLWLSEAEAAAVAVPAARAGGVVFAVSGRW